MIDFKSYLYTKKVDMRLKHAFQYKILGKINQTVIKILKIRVIYFHFTNLVKLYHVYKNQTTCLRSHEI
jgi:hypothetical protein